MPRLLAALAAAGALLMAAAPAQGASGVAVYPSPGTRYNLPGTQVTFRGIAPSQIGSVQVVGSSSGQHSGQIAADSDGQGGSFVPDQPFKRGEKVTVTTSLNVIGGSKGTFSFRIARTGSINAGPLLLVKGGSNALQHFRSRPDLLPPAVTVNRDSAPSSEGDIFVAPQYGPSQNGPMIFDPHGRLVWFDPFPVSKQMLITDFRVQAYHGQPVLTWWQGYTNRGSGRGVGIIFDHHYHQVAVVRAGNGLSMDLHEFLLTRAGTAWIIAVSPVFLPGISKMVIDAVVQEIDIPTGLVMFEWHALDHVSTQDSYFTPRSPTYVFDAYHMNSVEPDGSAAVLISMRNTSAVYKVSLSTGRVEWELGGKHSSFRLGQGAGTFFQHDAIPQPDGTVTMFDDGGGPPTLHPYARGIRVGLDGSRMVARLVTEYPHSPKFSTNFEGNVQQLGNGNVFMGWGQQPYFSEDDSHGRQIFDARFVVPSSSYRAYRFRWSGDPTNPPAIAVGQGPSGTTEVYASRNGATNVTAWRVLTGPAPTSLYPIGRGRAAGFETGLATHSQLAYFQVQALSSSGHVLGTSAVAHSGSHLAVFGRSAFVSGSGTGAVPVECVASSSCAVTTTVWAGRTVIARTGQEAVGVGRGRLLFFTLSGTGRSLLRHAQGHRLNVSVSVRDRSGLTGGGNFQLISFSTQGAGPHRSATGSAGLELVGATEFVSSSGIGGLLLACYSTSPCFVRGTLSVGRSTIASTRPEFVGPGGLGYLIFSLNATGRSMLDHASGNQLGATVALSAGGARASGQVALVRFS